MLFPPHTYPVQTTTSRFSRFSIVRCIQLSLLFIVSTCASAQYRPASFSSIDWRVQFIDAPNTDSLARKLTSTYQTDMEKVRAIFSWIAQHISYNTHIYSSARRNAVSRYIPEPDDTTTAWKSADEMTAEKVLRRRIAVCDGYAKLFKTLCNYAGLNAVVVTGYAKCNLEKSEKFRTNHSWNVVMIDSSWKLVDVTWATGYINFADEFVRHLDESYFLSSPKQFILDHYPEDLRWTLLEQTPPVREFRFSPFKCKSFVKYSISSIFPRNGTIDALPGDTIRIELETMDAKRDSMISADPFFDSTILTSSPASVFLQPALSEGRISYSYVVQNENVEWLHLLYNDDMILCYRLNVKKN
jgi:hypothetical protein